MIEVSGLRKRYGDTVALDGFDLATPAGSVCGLLGPNGAGKTTAVRVLATLLRPDSGTARVGGFDVVRQADRVRELIGLTGQFAAVDDALTGAENLRLIARLLELPRMQARRRVAEVLDRFGLADAAGRPVRTYSGGMRRRLDVAASLLGRPQVLFLDEPTTGLDPRSRADVWELVRGLVADGTTVLLTTQYLEEADRLADSVCVVDHGRVVRTGTPSQLKAQIGGHTLSVRPADPARIPDVVAVLGDAAVTSDGLVSVALSGGSDAAAVLAEAAAELRRAEVAVDELGVRLASLDEVFLALTGQFTAKEVIA
ncbi:MAG: ATP-binding cassette domain-containing protein [Hamadaea sp.]|nr:ATP-binding cassette domain-containing protein [Hamadaea sp.]NUT23835.1 ATP-binding cassette domain-containing protein [Hamadaea sp.]